MSFETLENLSIKLIDGDRGKNYPKQSDFFDRSDCLFLSAKNVTKNGFEFTDCSYISMEKDHQLRAGKLERNDIVLTTRGTIGNLALYDESVSISNIRINSGMIILRPNTTVWNPRFLYFLLNSDLIAQQISALTSGSAVPQLPARDLKKFILPLVPLSKQNKIVEIIGAVVDKVQLNRVINQTLEQMAQDLFKSWFVDFEPVKAKIAVLEAGGSQEDATLAAMTAISGKDADALAVFEREHPQQYAELKATAELFSSAMQDSELGDIPEGWSCEPISQIVMVKSGYAFKSKDFIDSGFPVIKIKNITGAGTVDVDNCQYVSSETVQGLNKFAIKNGDVLLAMTGATVGKVGIFVNNGFPAYLNQRVAKFECKKELSCNWFIYNIVSRSDFTSQILSTAQGSAQPNISAKEIESISRVMPLDSLIIAYENCVSKLYQFVMYNTLNNSLLTQLRDTLLPKLLSGEITLPEAEQAVSEAENV